MEPVELPAPRRVYSRRPRIDIGHLLLPSPSNPLDCILCSRCSDSVMGLATQEPIWPAPTWLNRYLQSPGSDPTGIVTNDSQSSPPRSTPLASKSSLLISVEKGSSPKHTPLITIETVVVSTESIPTALTAHSRWKVISWMIEFTMDHVDPRTILDMIDFREHFYPFSWRKYGVLLLVATAVAGIVVSEFSTHWMEASMALTRRYMLPVLIFVIGLEPIMITIILLVSRVPPIPTTPATDELESQMNEKHLDHRTALVIPCHNSDEAAMKKVLDSATPHFRPQAIFIVDNGNTKYPPSTRFRQFIRRQHPDIVYMWSPIGSKNAAQLAGAVAAKDYDYIMTVDDDVSIPFNFRPPIDKIDDVTKGVAFPLRAINHHGKTPLFMVAWQDCEYKISGLSKLAESALCGVLYPHGAGWFCERATLIDLLSRRHSLDFIAEDVTTGLCMQKMKRRIAMDARSVLETEVPATLLGRAPNWWTQRKNSWEMGRHACVFAFAARLLLSLNGQRSARGVLAQKAVHAYAIACIASDWVRVPVLVAVARAPAFWHHALLLTLAAALPLLALRYWTARRREDLRPGLWACVTYPFYKQVYATASIVGAVRCVIFYAGGHVRPRSVRQMVAEGDERLFWRDARFASNPAFLADEAEERGLLDGTGSSSSSSDSRESRR